MKITLTTDEPVRHGGSMGKLMDQLANKGYFGFYAKDAWAPAVNLYEAEGSYHVCVDLAGVDKKKIDVEVVGLRLTLRGNRAVPTCAATGSDLQAKRVRIHLMEIDHGPFSRDVELPEDVERDAIAAKYLNGMLWIELPKKAAAG